MLIVAYEILHHDVQLFLEHGLDDELTVVREEEKAARFTLRLASLEHGLIVEVRRQRLLDMSVFDTVEFTKILEHSVRKV